VSCERRTYTPAKKYVPGLGTALVSMVLGGSEFTDEEALVFVLWASCVSDTERIGCAVSYGMNLW
jgi:hypothetical protein